MWKCPISFQQRRTKSLHARSENTCQDVVETSDDKRHSSRALTEKNQPDAKVKGGQKIAYQHMRLDCTRRTIWDLCSSDKKAYFQLRQHSIIMTARSGFGKVIAPKDQTERPWWTDHNWSSTQASSSTTRSWKVALVGSGVSASDFVGEIFRQNRQSGRVCRTYT